MKTTFEEVKLYGEKSVKCAGGCGRRLKRRHKFFQTVNPFNKRADGQIKTREDIWAELKERLKHWQAEPEVCIHCQSR